MSLCLLSEQIPRIGYTGFGNTGEKISGWLPIPVFKQVSFLVIKSKSVGNRDCAYPIIEVLDVVQMSGGVTGLSKKEKPLLIRAANERFFETTSVVIDGTIDNRERQGLDNVVVGVVPGVPPGIRKEKARSFCIWRGVSVLDHSTNGVPWSQNITALL